MGSRPAPARLSVRFNRLAYVFVEFLEPRRLMSTGAILLQDDFNGSALDTNKWQLPVAGPASFLGRTQLRVAGSGNAPVVANGYARLRLDTFNPTANTPGDSFLGSEIFSRNLFNRGSAGLNIEARVRIVGPTAKGIVNSLFMYNFRSAEGVRDEIDVELLTNRVADGTHDVLTNVFNDDGFNTAGAVKSVDVAGLSLTGFNTYRIAWLPNAIEWYVNGALVRRETSEVANDPMTVRLNAWAPSQDFVQAFSSTLQPSATAAANQVFYYDVDYVKVSEVPPPDGAGNTLAAAKAVGTLSGSKSFSDAVHSTDGNDYYKFSIGSTSTFTASLGSLTGDANLQLIRDANGNGVVDTADVLATSAAVGTSAESIKGDLSAGTYFARVYPATATTAAGYTLTLSATATAEPGNALASARVIGTLSGSRVYVDSGGGSDTNDFYRFTLSSSRSVKLVLDGLTSNASLQLIRDADGDGTIDAGDVLATSANTGTTAETITRTLAAGTYYVRVLPVGTAASRYVLHLSA